VTKIFRYLIVQEDASGKSGVELLHSKSQDFLAEAGEDELDTEERGAVVLVENGIDLDDF